MQQQKRDVIKHKNVELLREQTHARISLLMQIWQTNCWQTHSATKLIASDSAQI